MMNHRKTRNIALGTLLVPVFALGLTACSEEAPPPPPKKAPAPPPPPPAPVVKDVASLVQELNIDPRIMLPEEEAPMRTEDRRAILQFLDAMTRGNAERVRSMLASEDQNHLDALLQSGQWDKTVSNIDDVMVFTGSNTNTVGVGSSMANLAVLAIFTVNGEMQPTMWYLENGAFTAAPTPVNVLDRISGADPIVAWHNIINEIRTRGTQTDVELQVPKTILDQRSTGGGSGNPEQPSQPGGPTPPSLPSPGGPGPGGPGPGPGVPL